MTDIVKVKSNGLQVFPQTHAEAIIGLKTIKGEKGEPGVAGPQGPKGETGPSGQNATTTATATSTIKGLMAAADKQKLDSITQIIFEKVGEV